MTKKNVEPMERRLMSYREAAGYLGISERGMKQLAAEGKIRKVQIGHRVLFDRSDVDGYVEKIKKAS